MSAKYWIAKYVDDVFRNEPKNVGVIVEARSTLSARFFGEREDKTFDARKLGARFAYPQIYTQWRDYWRDTICKGGVDEVVRANSANYYVDVGGEISDIGTDSSSDVCRFLFDLLVEGGGVATAFQWDAEEAIEQSLSAEIVELFQQSHLIADGPQLTVRHPVEKEREIQGQHVLHKPSFAQQNGLLYVFDHLDMTRPKQKPIRERAGFIGYMFNDIKAAHSGAKAYSIVKPASDGEAVAFAKSVLGAESEVVNWLDAAERGRFMDERRKVADSI